MLTVFSLPPWGILVLYLNQWSGISLAPPAIITLLKQISPACLELASFCSGLYHLFLDAENLLRADTVKCYHDNHRWQAVP